MRQTLSKIVKILDGQPTSKRGQSMVEMALTAPLLILMILSLVEIGFFANNYLILLDAIRAASRVAVNLDPTTWPYNEARNEERMDCDNLQNTWLMIPNGNTVFPPGDAKWEPGQRISPAQFTYPFVPRGQHLTSLARNPYTSGVDTTLGFFDTIACQVTVSMAPLVLNDDVTERAASRDDIVVSAVSYITMDYTNIAPGGGRTAQYTSIIQPLGNHYVTVTGRWPIENRYCRANGQGDTRDPFDYLRADFDTAYHNGWLGANHNASDGTSADYNTSSTPKTYEGPTTDPNVISNDPTHRDWRILDPNTATDSQDVRGYVFTGNHITEDGSNCYGSDFTVQDIEQRLNLSLTANDLNKSAPNGGLVIVEVFWQHHPLFFGPLFQGFVNGTKLNDPVLHVWSFYPIPAVESTPTPKS